MGEVYEAWDEELSIPVALKTLHLAGATEEAHKRLKLEGLLARSVWHPNVCRLYDLGRHGEGEDAVWFLTMELLSGETLAGRLQNGGRLPLAGALRFAEQMAAGLGAAHRAGVVHRDFKTGNVMLVARDGDEQAMVTDFGIARAASPRMGANELRGPAGPIVGTPTYMAPEQVRGDEVGPAADIYALGIVLYEMVTGAVPFTGDSAIQIAERRLAEDPPSPRHFLPDLDSRWEAVILRCIARDPHDRFARAEEVADALAGRGPVGSPHSLDFIAGRTRFALPPERDPFVGREVECEELERHFSRGSHLVTLAGTGGMGKTRLAIHYGWQQLAAWPGGVWFCDLTEARSANDVASAVAGSLGAQLGRGDPVEQLAHAIAGHGRCLLILDNFEQVIDDAEAIVGRWLARATDARFLVTSREKLGLRGEQVQPVGPLSIETGVELLAARAERLRPGLDLRQQDAESAREIVRLVDGMPLAIELAGARLRVMSAVQIVTQMRRRFSLLTGGGSARHETLIAAIDGSWELLEPWEQSAWAQCAVFEGGFTLEAAEEVLDLDAWPEAPWVVDCVQSLVDKSLLRTWVPLPRSGEGSPGTRFGMYVTLQEYARMKLRDPELPGAKHELGAERASEERHGRWYARYGTPESVYRLRNHVGAAQLRHAEGELDNLLAACRRSVVRGDAATAVATYRASWAILDSRGPFGVAVDLGREILERLHLEPVEAGHVLQTLGRAEWYSGQVESSRPHMEAALAIAREVADRQLEAHVLGNLGSMDVTQGRMAEGAIHLEMALDGARAVSDQFLECNTLNTLGVARRGQGRFDEARACGEMALDLASAAAFPSLAGSALSNLGLLHQDQGRTAEALDHYEAALKIFRQLGVRRLEGNVRVNLGGLCSDQGKMEDARMHLDAALIIHRETGSRASEGIALTNLGLMHYAQEHAAEARASFEAALGIARESGNRRLEGAIIAALGRLHQDQGETDEAHTSYEAALAIHRVTNDRRSEGLDLAYLASLLAREGAIEPARATLAAAEALLRHANASVSLGQVLCIRAELEHGCGNTAVALAALAGAEDLASRFGSGPHSDLGRMMAKVRQSMATNGVQP
jgi:predicted ATPase/Tfp pilus assembly protein PilF